MDNVPNDDTIDGVIDKMGTIYIDGLRRSAMVSPVLEVYNISFKKACEEYGEAAQNAVKNEVKQMIDKYVHIHNINIYNMSNITVILVG